MNCEKLEMQLFTVPLWKHARIL